VNIFGGYYDLQDPLRAVAAHEDASDRESIDRHLIGGGSVDQSPGDLTPANQFIHALLNTSDPATIDAVISALPPEIHGRLAALSPNSGINRLRAKAFIMHDVSDPYVLVTESSRLAKAISDPKQKVYIQFSLFHHVRLRRSLKRLTLAQEAARSFIYLSYLLREIMPSP